MRASMRAKPSLCHSTVLPVAAKGINHVGAVVLLIRFALAAGKICANLGSHSYSVADFDGLHIFANLDRLSDDLVADADGKRAVAPSCTSSAPSTRPRIAYNEPPLMVWTSEAQTPQQSIATSMSRSPKVFSGNCGTGQGDELKSLANGVTNLLLFEICPFLLVFNHKAFCGLWVRHVCCIYRSSLGKKLVSW